VTARAAPWGRPTLLPWVKLPSTWINDGQLKWFGWSRGEGADDLAALMALMVIAHHTHRDTGYARLTWDELCSCASLSRGKLSEALKILAAMKLVERAPEGRSSFRLLNYGPEDRWAKLPARGLYSGDSITAFRQFTFRLPAELDAMKLYFLIAARRDQATNATLLTIDKLADQSGVSRNNISRATSLLASLGLLHVSNIPSEINPNGVANVYRLAHLESRRHPGTIGRGADYFEQ
jgi:DNA-binding transcriptional ArsR family regulator